MKKAFIFDVVAVVILLVLTGCAQADEPTNNKPARDPYQLSYPRVSIIQLLSNPDGYDEKKVSVGGYLVSDMHWSPLVVYAHKDYYLNRLNENSIAVDIEFSSSSGVSEEYIKNISGNYGVVSGVFHATHNGSSMYLYMDDVYQVQTTPNPAIQR